MGITVLQIEHAPGMLVERRAILESQGYAVVSILGAADAFDSLLLRLPISVVVIGHGIALAERQTIIAHFRLNAPAIPIVSLVGKRNQSAGSADFICSADTPSGWLKLVRDAVAAGVCS